MTKGHVSPTIPKRECSPSIDGRSLSPFNCGGWYPLLKIILISGLFFDPNWIDDLFECWTSFDTVQNIGIQPWFVLCVYTRPEDVHWNKNVDIRFYSSLEKDINEGRQLTDDGIYCVQLFLEGWSTVYLNEHKNVLPAQFNFLFGSFHSNLVPSALNAFQIPKSRISQPWIKYIFSTENIPSEPIQLPPDFEVDTIYPQHFDVILSSSSIPRTKHYLSTRIPASTALYRSNTRDIDPIAFCLTAPDRSLSTLWVNPNYRGFGLGKFVARQRLLGPNGMLSRGVVIPRGGGNEEVSEWGEAAITWLKWSHADIAENNAGSRADLRMVGWENPFNSSLD